MNEGFTPRYRSLAQAEQKNLMVQIRFVIKSIGRTSLYNRAGLLQFLESLRSNNLLCHLYSELIERNFVRIIKCNILEKRYMDCVVG